jgi:VIT1/CCC1 family predicted Fe2+/Mn2+ transporter
MMKLASAIDALAARLPDSDPRKSEFRSRSAALGQECACAMGGLFLIGAAVLAIGYFATTKQLSTASALVAIGLVFVASLMGKLVGLAVVRIRLLTLRRAIARRLSKNEARHVHMH